MKGMIRLELRCKFKHDDNDNYMKILVTALMMVMTTR